MKRKLLFMFLTVVAALCLTFAASANVFAWQSSGSSNPTHSFLVDRAIAIMESDLGSTITSDSDYVTLKSFLAQLKQGSLDPDNLTNVALGGLTENDWWSSHFYDPDTNACYSSSTPWINAEYQTRRYIGMAVAAWKNGDPSQGAYLLGYASHFFADLNEPNHAANNTILDWPYNHGDFETYAQNRQSIYAITTVYDGTAPVNTMYTNTLNNFNTMNDFLTDLSRRYSKIAKNNFSWYLNTTDSSGWDYAARPTLADAQRGLALIYYRFIKELKLVRRLTVTVTTANELWAGTDNDIYFGMRATDGSTMEYLLDKKDDLLGGTYQINTYNDFEQGNTDSYNIYIYNKTFDFGKVYQLWLRKSVYIASDDWKCGSVTVSLDNVPVRYDALNRWFYGNTEYDWAVNGLNPNNPAYIGVVDVTIHTSDVLWAGTDDNIYFGMQLDTGRYVEYLLDKSGYNDFERNATDTYSFTITDPTFQASQIRNLWLRKESVLGDDWAVYSITVKMRGTVVYTKTINTWLTGSTTYYMPVNGLYY